MSYVIIDYLDEDIEYLFVEPYDESNYCPPEDLPAQEYKNYEPIDGYSRYTPQENEYRMLNSMTNSEQMEYLRNKRYQDDEPFDVNDYEYRQETFLDDVRGDITDYY